MAWKETTKMEQKIEFINEWRSGNYSISELCRQFKISKPTAYKYIKRYEEEGIGGLNERNRKPYQHPLKPRRKLNNKSYSIERNILGGELRRYGKYYIKASRERGFLQSLPLTEY